MKTIRFNLIISIIFITFFYIYLFLLNEKNIESKKPSLNTPLTTNFYKVASGYLAQLTSEMLFIRTSVFLGNIFFSSAKENNNESISKNFEVMTNLYPQFIDPYFFTQAFLPSISRASAKKANSILELGIKTLPDNLIIRFFYATNFFLYMDDPASGSKAFADASKISGAPRLFGHMAALLSAQNGDIEAGLISLKTMLNIEHDENIRLRYKEEIVTFETALRIKEAITTYTELIGSAPTSLEQLVPKFLPEIPAIEESFILVYNPPKLSLKRPSREKTNLSSKHAPGRSGPEK